jgi:hypothetical protein
MGCIPLLATIYHIPQAVVALGLNLIFFQYQQYGSRIKDDEVAIRNYKSDGGQQGPTNKQTRAAT